MATASALNCSTTFEAEAAAGVFPPVSVIPCPTSGGTHAIAGAPVYVGFDGGLAMQQNVTLSAYGESERISFDNGFRLDLQLGLPITTNWTLEAELGLVCNQVKKSYLLGTDYETATLLQFPLLLNVIYVQPLGRGWSVYAGAGAGMVTSQYEYPLAYSTSSGTAFGYQGQVGIKYALSQWAYIGLAYKMLGTTGYDLGSSLHSDGNLSQSLLLSLGVSF